MTPTWVILVATILAALAGGLMVYLFLKTVEGPVSVEKAARKMSRAADDMSKAAKAVEDIPRYRDSGSSSFSGSWFETWTKTEYTMKCGHCGTVNRLRSKNLEGTRCGKCGLPFKAPTTDAKPVKSGGTN